jgi:hypothetical protein
VLLHGRLRRAAAIGQESYALPAADPIVGAIEGTAGNIRQLEAAIEPPQDNGQQQA